MYILFRCDCGRTMYSKQGVARKKCVCGRNLKIKDRKILCRTDTASKAAEMVQKYQEEKYGNAYFTTADKIYK